MIKPVLLLFTLVYSLSGMANYNTPGTGVKWTLINLVENSNGNVTMVGSDYFVNDTVYILQNDTLSITTDVIVKFAAATQFDVNGVIIVEPPTSVVFTAQNPATGFNGLRIDSSHTSVLKKFTLEYATCLRLGDANVRIDSSVFQFNNRNNTTSFGDGSISLFRSAPLITNTRFVNNERSAIQGGSNISNAPKIIGCFFMGNNTTNQNRPQINLGATSATGSDTTKILNNQILRASTRSGAIGFLPAGNVYAVISGNVIKNNRYGITFNGGSNINAMVSYNVIDSNNTEGDPLLGGSGISFSGGSSTSHQKVIVTGNLIRWNLWGITIGSTTTGGGAMPNLGNVSNADTSDDGKNFFLNNTNASTPFIDLYNNNVDNIEAQNNNWGTNDLNVVETKIFHQPDNSALGLVNYTSILLPVELANFTAKLQGNASVLHWQTLMENNSKAFVIEKSYDGMHFLLTGMVPAKGVSNVPVKYTYKDVAVDLTKKQVYYRLKLLDKDATYKYSPIVKIVLNKTNNHSFVYPTLLHAGENIMIRYAAENAGTIHLQLIDADGKIIQQQSAGLLAGLQTIKVETNKLSTKGIVYVRVANGKQIETHKLTIQ